MIFLVMTIKNRMNLPRKLIKTLTNLMKILKKFIKTLKTLMKVLRNLNRVQIFRKNERFILRQLMNIYENKQSFLTVYFLWVIYL